MKDRGISFSSLTPRRISSMLAMLLLAAGCSNSVKPGGTAVVRPESATTTTDPWAVPSTIDVPYVQRVMDRLDQSLGDAIRELVATKSVDPKVDSIYRSVYSGDELVGQESDIRDIAARGASSLKEHPGNPSTSVEKILSSMHDCVYFSTKRTFQETFKDPTPPHDLMGYVAMVRQTKDASGEFNPTGWILVMDGRSSTGQIPKDPCP